MSSIGELFGFPGEQNEAPVSVGGLDMELDRILASRPPAGAPEGYVRPEQLPPAPGPDGDQTGAVGGAPGAVAPVAPEAPPALPPWPQGPASAWPPAAPEAPPAQPLPPSAPATPPPAAPPGPTDPFAGLSEIERHELLLIHQAMRDPDRQAQVRRAYIGAPEPVGYQQPPAPAPFPPVAAGPPVVSPTPAAPALPDDIDPQSFEAQVWHAQQEQARQLAEIRAQVTQQGLQTDQQNANAAAASAKAAFAQRYGGVLSPEEMQWVAQMAGYQGLPDIFAASDPKLTAEQAMTKALDFQMRSTDSLLVKVLGGQGAPPATGIPAPPPQPPGSPPMVYPGQTPEADARKRYLTAVSSAASPSGEAPVRTPIQHRADGRIDERSRMDLVKEMTSGGTMSELMGPS